MRKSLQGLGVDMVAVEDGGFLLHGSDSDWLRAVFIAFGYHARIEGTSLRVPFADADSVRHAVRSALAPEAIILDLDGVLADIQTRKSVASVDDVQKLAVKYPIGVVTTCPRRMAESVLEHHGFAPYISVVVGSEDGPCKPDPFPVRRALQSLGQQTAWMVGDNPSDVTAARAACVVPFAVLPHGLGADVHLDRLRAAGAVRFIESVAALPSLLVR